MAHECPICGMICHCNGDIDDICIDLEEDVLACIHCQDCDNDIDCCPYDEPNCPDCDGCDCCPYDVTICVDIKEL